MLTLMHIIRDIFINYQYYSYLSLTIIDIIFVKCDTFLLFFYIQIYSICFNDDKCCIDDIDIIDDDIDILICH